MVGKPARPGESARPGEDEGSDEQRLDEGATPGQSTEGVERLGPIGVAHLRKGDGRALILYSAGGSGA